MKYMKHYRRITAWVLAVLVTVILLFSYFFVLTHMDHKCTGEGCHVCAEIGACMTTLHVLSEAVGAGAVSIFAYIFMKKIIIAYLAGFFLIPVSLVRLKIRLDD
ncbi:AraC family transcriptional regulator [Clostridium sp. Marseille-P2415]|uniref:AraC family transcriptional regulator n=1 Tax=Clostridium sp. Marseille-P2415 TaxID=1805471 RepID=UPI0009887467|nr:AraC family transcriptional regulator [Clostridium sp. Marseille-P2415]